MGSPQRDGIFAKLRNVLLPIGAAALLGGCADLGYYAQAVGGQMELLNGALPVDALLDAPDTNQDLKRALHKAAELRTFASRELHLPDNQSYTRYADLHRPYVLWNVFATDEFSTTPKQWCFIGLGCVSYRGFFSQQDAQDFAAALRREGNDVYLGGVPAYSTLGWFNDPLLSTYIGYPETELAQLLFHELAHQVVYVQDDSAFNESFATAVELEGVNRWLALHGDAAQRSAFEARQQRKAADIGKLLHARKQLEALYAGSAGAAATRAAKQVIFDALRADLAQAHPERRQTLQLNNAQLASIATYTQLVPAFRALLAQQQGDMGKFFAAVKNMSALPRHERNAVLQAALEDNRRKLAANP
jgi:predicted aminopeptidase